ncbi:MAG: glycosyltransferase, partial [Lysobacterales bacterium CG_4_9_14_3_um_filter_62_6]
QPSRIEGLCIAMHEAMQAGLPVIASAVGQMADTLEPGRSGWLVPSADPSALADALAAALSDPARLASFGQAARSRVLTRFSAAIFRQSGNAILQRLATLPSP